MWTHVHVCFVVALHVRLSVVCNVRAPYSGDWNFRQCFYATQLFVRDQTAYIPFPPSCWNLTIIFFNNAVFFQFVKSFLAVYFQLLEMPYSHARWPFVTYIQFQLFIKEFKQVIQWFSLSILAETRDLLQTAAKWRCIKLCAIFFWTNL